MDQIRRRPNANEPERSFATPHEIIASTELTRGQKHLALDRWKTLVEVRLRKSRSPTPTDVALHQAILKARGAMNSSVFYWLSPAGRSCAISRLAFFDEHVTPVACFDWRFCSGASEASDTRCGKFSKTRPYAKGLNGVPVVIGREVLRGWAARSPSKSMEFISPTAARRQSCRSIFSPVQCCPGFE